jgi:serine/threonine protein kinase
MPLADGAQLASYQTLSLIGVGGMGEVYLARDQKLGREVAVKILRGELAQEAERLNRFEREARLLASLNHPYIATLYGMEEAEGVRFLVMEFVPGATLADRLAGGPLPVDESLSLARQIAEALEAAHEKGVIHRDLKPGNVKITPAGKVKLLDFGLAKPVAVGISPSDETTTHEATREGLILGTPYYMSPEQVRGQALDRRTDIWSFGCVLFESLTGKRPFPGQTGPDIFAAILEREPDWELLPPAVPPPILGLLERCFRKDPGRRLRDIGDARLELADATDPAPTPRAALLAASKPASSRVQSSPHAPREVTPNAPREAPGPKPQLPPPWMVLAANAKRERVVHVQTGIFFTRLKDLRKLYRRTPLVWLVGAFVALVSGLLLGLAGGFLMAPWVGPESPWVTPFAILVGVISAILTGLAIAAWWNSLLAQRLRLLHKLHPHDIDQWGGETLLSDHLAIEGLLEVMERENN